MCLYCIGRCFTVNQVKHPRSDARYRAPLVVRLRGCFPRYSCASERDRQWLPSTMRCSYHLWFRNWLLLLTVPGEHPVAHFLMRDGFTPIERGDGVLGAGNLRLIHIQIFADGLRCEKGAATAGNLGEFFEPVPGRGFDADGKFCDRSCSYPIAFMVPNPLIPAMVVRI